MHILLWQDKDKPWRFVCIRVHKYEHGLFWLWNWTPNNRWLWRPRFHAMINLWLLSFVRNNICWQIGVGLGKRHISLDSHF